MSRDDDPKWVGPILVVGFLGLSIVWVVINIFLTVIGLLCYALATGINIFGLEQSPEELMGPIGVSVSGILQTSGLVGVAVGLVALVPLLTMAAKTKDQRPFWERIKTAFALKNGLPSTYVIALLGGLSVGMFPAWLAEQMRAMFPNLGFGSLELITNLLNTDDVIGKAAMMVTVVIMAPLCEELIFRGFLWDAAARFMPRWGVWLTTSVLFAVYHMDPIQGTAVLFTGLFIGWLRYIGGSVWPAVVAHFVNNGLAASFALIVGTDDSTPMPIWLALVGASFTICLCCIGWATGRKTQ
ncbi:MAG: CPBP family intramembrane metalloprotease [Proteobacteria bacterium]|jgi:membrane protease YdiL (CAAX protease family)|nr:CPBP family intramembrane metalloprotease [Pseudomonadota bacterium]